MTRFSVKEAQQRLPELLDEGARGEEIVIDGDGATYKVTVVALEPRQGVGRVAGLGQGKTVLSMSDDFDEESPEINALFYGA